MQTFFDYIQQFNQELDFTGHLPDEVQFMNPYKNEEATKISEKFYRKYYVDTHSRYLILGINPGRHGAGVTGVPFTDSKRLFNVCGVDPENLKTHEVSSVFVYEMIGAYGGVQSFYQKFYINSPCPLGLLQLNKKGHWINCNYYDSKVLLQATDEFIQSSMSKLLNFPINRDVAFVLGMGKNFQVLSKKNQQYNWFKELVALEHPRFIMQYRSKQKQQYIDKYLRLFQGL